MAVAPLPVMVIRAHPQATVAHRVIAGVEEMEVEEAGETKTSSYPRFFEKPEGYFRGETNETIHIGSEG